MGPSTLDGLPFWGVDVTLGCKYSLSGPESSFFKISWNESLTRKQYNVINLKKNVLGNYFDAFVILRFFFIFIFLQK